MGFSTVLILIMLSRDNRYNQIQEINDIDNTENNYKQDQTPEDEEDYPISVLDKNMEAVNSNLTQEKNSSIKEQLIDNYEFSSSTGPSTLRDPKIRHLFGNEYIELYSNENEDIEKSDVRRFHSGSSGIKEKNIYQINQI